MFANPVKIGKGGLGSIYKAYHTNLNKYVVIKKIKVKRDISFIRREVDILKNLHHQYLPAIYDFIEVEGNYYIVEDFIDGVDLQKYVDAKQFIPEAYIIKWLSQMCEVLDYLHSRKPPVIHSDIKPSNIMIDSNGDICLIDFNISFLQEYGSSVIGFSQFYCSPEQFTNAASGVFKPIDVRSDIYSTAATFYALCSGRVPVVNKKNKPLIEMKLRYSESLLNLIDKGMAVRPENRWQSAKQMHNGLLKNERLTHKYKVYSTLRFALSSLGVLIIVGGILSLANGKKIETADKLQKEIHSVESRYESSGVDSKTAADIEALLSFSDYKKELNNDANTLAQLYAMLGEYYYNFDTATGYAAAADYYGRAYKAIKSDFSSAALCRKYALNYISALIMSDRSALAQSVVNEIGEQNNMTVSVFVDVQLLYSEGKYYEAEFAARKLYDGSCAEDSSDDKEVEINICNTAAASAQKLFSMNANQYAEYNLLAAQWYDRVLELEKTPDALRNAASAYFTAALFGNQKESLLYKSLSYYDQITTQTDDDKLNIAQVRIELRDYNGSLQILYNLPVTDNPLKCKQNYLIAVSLTGLNNTEKARNYIDSAVDIYNSLPEKQRGAIDSAELERVNSLIGSGKEIK